LHFPGDEIRRSKSTNSIKARPPRALMVAQKEKKLARGPHEACKYYKKI